MPALRTRLGHDAEELGPDDQAGPARHQLPAQDPRRLLLNGRQVDRRAVADGRQVRPTRLTAGEHRDSRRLRGRGRRHGVTWWSLLSQAGLYRVVRVLHAKPSFDSSWGLSEAHWDRPRRRPVPPVGTSSAPGVTAGAGSSYKTTR